MRLIGINGFKGAGKDTTFECIQRGAPASNVSRVGFADKLKVMAARSLGFLHASDEDLIKWMNECKEKWSFKVDEPSLVGLDPTVAQFSGRQFLQWFGGGARDVFGDTFWVDQVLPKPEAPLGLPEAERRSLLGDAVAARYPGVDILCITDVRYANEAERVLKLGGEVWEIVRPGLESDGHASEIPLDPELVSGRIINDGTIDQLERIVWDVL